MARFLNSDKFGQNPDTGGCPDGHGHPLKGVVRNVRNRRSQAQALPTERQVHRAILAMIRTCFPRAIAHHSPNGAHLAGNSTARFKQVGALLGDGMLKGFPDILILWPHGCGCLIEVKRPKLGKLTGEQKDLHERLQSLGWKVAVCSDVESAFAFLRDCGAPWNGSELVQ